jgi:hypothetical protein
MRRILGRGLAAGATIVASAVAAAPAAGYTVTVSGAAPDKVLTITSDGSSAVRLTNSLLEHFVIAPVEGMAEPFTAPDCIVGMTAEAYCGPVGDFGRIEFAGGDGTDVLIADLRIPTPPWEPQTIIDIPIEATGAGGNDTLSTSAGADVLDGGPGEDRLSGGPGRDELLGGPDGDDLLGGDGDDLLEGGAGADDINGNDEWLLFPPGPLYVPPPAVDTVDYSARTAPVTVDAQFIVSPHQPEYNVPGTGGEAGEGDVLWSIERVLGGSADDVLRGALSAPDVLVGGPGDDSLDGRSGDDELAGGPDDDELTGGPGRDGLAGGTGNDYLDSFDGAADAPVDCGAGADDRLFADNTLDLDGAVGCETVAPEFATPPRVGGEPRVGQTLTYAGATVTGSPSVLSFQWSRCTGDCDVLTPIDGATGAAYVVRPEDAGHSLVLSVVATNRAGTDEADAGPLAVPRARAVPPAVPPAAPPPPAPPAPAARPARVAAPPPLPRVATVRRARITATRGVVTVDTGRRATCPAGPGICRLSVLGTVRPSGRTPVVAGRRTLSIAAGRSARLTFRLNRTGVRLLRSRGRLSLALTFQARRGTRAPRTTRANVALRAPRGR